MHAAVIQNFQGSEGFPYLAHGLIFVLPKKTLRLSGMSGKITTELSVRRSDHQETGGDLEGSHVGYHLAEGD